MVSPTHDLKRLAVESVDAPTGCAGKCARPIGQVQVLRILAGIKRADSLTAGETGVLIPPTPNVPLILKDDIGPRRCGTNDLPSVYVGHLELEKPPLPLQGVHHLNTSVVILRRIRSHRHDRQQHATQEPAHSTHGFPPAHTWFARVMVAYEGTESQAESGTSLMHQCPQTIGPNAMAKVAERFVGQAIFFETHQHGAQGRHDLRARDEV